VRVKGFLAFLQYFFLSPVFKGIRDGEKGGGVVNRRGANKINKVLLSHNGNTLFIFFSREGEVGNMKRG